MSTEAVDGRRVLAARLAAHRLRSPDLPDVPTAVGHLVAVQGQEFHPALWGLTRRLRPDARPGAAGAVAPRRPRGGPGPHGLRPPERESTRLYSRPGALFPIPAFSCKKKKKT